MCYFLICHSLERGNLDPRFREDDTFSLRPSSTFAHVRSYHPSTALTSSRDLRSRVGGARVRDWWFLNSHSFYSCLLSNHHPPSLMFAPRFTSSLAKYSLRRMWDSNLASPETVPSKNRLPLSLLPVHFYYFSCFELTGRVTQNTLSQESQVCV